jgi:L-ascorbate metabolism protein UlaG (beta-lactamase superfamily)
VCVHLPQTKGLPDLDCHPRAALHTATLSTTWVGHSTVLLNVEGVRLLTDPMLRRRVGPLRRLVPTPALESLRSLDAILLSHLHQDHFDLPSLELLDRDTPILVPRGAERWLTRAGFAAVQGMEPGDTVRVADLRVTAVPARHSAPRYPFLRHDLSLGFVVAGKHHVYFPGDTGLFDGMASISRHLDLAFIPIGGWGPRVPEESHLDPLRAAQALALLQPRVAIPVHWGTYQLSGLRLAPSFRRVDDAPRRFVDHTRHRAPDVLTVLLSPGQSIDVAALLERGAA